jgi:hypothetical protein
MHGIRIKTKIQLEQFDPDHYWLSLTGSTREGRQFDVTRVIISFTERLDKLS